jgi:N-acetylmuramoyl-L-alanine amidase
VKRAAALLAGLLAACAAPAPDVALDVGHGLAEPGARSASGIPEFQYNLALAQRVRAAGFAPSRYHADPGVGEGRPFADEANGVHWFDDLAVAASATMPAVLVEAGVIVNPAEERSLAESPVQERIARAIAKGVEQCLS